MSQKDRLEILNIETYACELLTVLSVVVSCVKTQSVPPSPFSVTPVSFNRKAFLT